MTMVTKIPNYVPDFAIMHSYPVGDIREHNMRGRGVCWCNPRIEEVEFGYAVMHNSMDGRELYECGQRRPS